MKRIYGTMILLGAAAGLALAQGPRAGGGQGRMTAGGPGLTLAMTNTRTVTGSVTAVNIGWGMQYPSIAIDRLQIKVAPVWYLLEKNFEIKVGDNLSVAAAPSSLASDPYLYAVDITNGATGAHILLRDPNGLPLWSQRGYPAGAGSGAGPTADGACVQVLSIETVSGVIDQVTSGPGIQMPSLTLKTADGKLLVIKLGPERILLEADLELKTGDTIAIKYAVTQHDGELVALAIGKGGVTVALRSDDCRPLWR
jgi:hypothetical protein